MNTPPRVFSKKELITVRELAKRLGCSRRHAYRLVELGPTCGGVLAFRFGVKRGLRVPVEEVERLRERCVVEE